MEERVRVEDYAHSPAHYAVALSDKRRLERFLATLPRLAPPSAILTESDSARESRLADIVSAALDRRDVPRRDTALHLAVRLNLPAAVSSLAAAGMIHPSRTPPGGPLFRKLSLFGDALLPLFYSAIIASPLSPSFAAAFPLFSLLFAASLTFILSSPSASTPRSSRSSPATPSASGNAPETSAPTPPSPPSLPLSGPAATLSHSSSSLPHPPPTLPVHSSS
ncbi:hypothetical protein J5N97_011337 [Dioscorea zingiberensis]|uniref:Uncharacterized protein n=1 Tax=Dioscorea zingiberensis TaxID=325984 RepID=A0A9D5D2I4_9LILI|nr:hypothetical protein J5N97_011337 [Dioscorea zingiberensis]